MSTSDDNKHDKTRDVDVVTVQSPGPVEEEILETRCDREPELPEENVIENSMNSASVNEEESCDSSSVIEINISSDDIPQENDIDTEETILEEEADIIFINDSVKVDQSDRTENVAIVRLLM